MKILDVEQGSAGWLSARSGIPTASNFHRLLTPKELKPAKGAWGYVCEMIADRMLGRPSDDATSAWMQRGTEMEQDARDWYELATGGTIKHVGLCVHDTLECACSPDGLVDEDGGVEIKTPAAKTHVGYVLDPETVVAEYRLQVLGCLWITGRAWWDLISYSPIMPKVVHRFLPDAGIFAALDTAIGAATNQLDWATEQMRAKGFVVPSPPIRALLGRPDSILSLEDALRASVQEGVA